jgi:hypothetical protein
VKLVPLKASSVRERPIGLYKGQIDIGPEFFDPLPDEELALWEHGASDDLLLSAK